VKLDFLGGVTAVFGRKLDVGEASTLYGGLVRRGDEARGMPYSYDPADNVPFIPSDGVVTSEPLGTFTSRKLGEDAAPALAAFSERRMAEDEVGRSGWTSHRSRHRADLDTQLERLGIRTSGRPLQRTRVFDLPL
jgi:hypothetical protein